VWDGRTGQGGVEIGEAWAVSGGSDETVAGWEGALVWEGSRIETLCVGANSELTGREADGHKGEEWRGEASVGTKEMRRV
jgi:hypothetical protein